MHLGMAYLDVSAQQGTEAGVEGAYRWGQPLVWRLHPQVGAAVFSDGSAYAYTGLALPLSLGARVSLVPSMGAGAFSEGEEVELGSVLEFRSALTLGVAVGRDHGVSLSLYHLSNAGLGDRNPGVEVLGLAYWLRR
jgi:lipid A 3-O-deacylase